MKDNAGVSLLLIIFLVVMALYVLPAAIRMNLKGMPA